MCGAATTGWGCVVSGRRMGPGQQGHSSKGVPTPCGGLCVPGAGREGRNTTFELQRAEAWRGRGHAGDPRGGTLLLREPLPGPCWRAGPVGAIDRVPGPRALARRAPAWQGLEGGPLRCGRGCGAGEAGLAGEGRGVLEAPWPAEGCGSVWTHQELDSLTGRWAKWPASRKAPVGDTEGFRGGEGRRLV